MVGLLTDAAVAVPLPPEPLLSASVEMMEVMMFPSNVSSRWLSCNSEEYSSRLVTNELKV